MKNCIFLIVILIAQVNFAQENIIKDIIGVRYTTKSFNLRKQVKQVISEKRYLEGIAYVKR